MAGVAASVAVQPADAWGNPRVGRGDRLWLQHAILGGPPMQVEMQADSTGAHAAQFVVPSAGQDAVAVSITYGSPQVRFATDTHMHCVH